jgi:integrase
MDPTARLLEDYLDRRTPHPGVGADADPLFQGPHQTRLTRWGVTKILARLVQSVRGRNPGYAAGVNVTPHVIRRTRAMHLLNCPGFDGDGVRCCQSAWMGPEVPARPHAAVPSKAGVEAA